MIKTHKAISGLVLLVAVLAMACTPGIASSAPELPGGPVRISEEAAKRLDDKITQALQQNPSGRFTLSVTDEEFSSWVAFRVANEPEAMITDPQVRFTQGKIFGAVTLKGVLPFDLRTILEANVKIVDDRVVFQIQKSTVGPFPAPGFVRDALSKTINDTLLEAQLDVQVTNIDIRESEIVIAGQLRNSQ
jgi:hypothetical protein